MSCDFVSALQRPPAPVYHSHFLNFLSWIPRFIKEPKKDSFNNIKFRALNFRTIAALSIEDDNDDSIDAAIDNAVAILIELNAQDKIDWNVIQIVIETEPSNTPSMQIASRLLKVLDSNVKCQDTAFVQLRSITAAFSPYSLHGRVPSLSDNRVTLLLHSDPVVKPLARRVHPLFLPQAIAAEDDRAGIYDE